MKRFFIAALSLAFGLAAPRAFAQSTPASAPLDRIEILGRLAVGYSPSYIAYLVKTRGLSFTVSATFLDQVTQAGGRGILVDNLPHAESPNSLDSDPDAGPPIEHLAKCAQLIHTGDLESAETECRASMDENPSSQWPLRAKLGIFELTISSWKDPLLTDAQRNELGETQQRLISLFPNAPPARSFIGGFSLADSQRELDPQTLETLESNGLQRRREILSAFADPAEVNLTDALGPLPDSGEPSGRPVPPQLLAFVQSDPDLAAYHLFLASSDASDAHNLSGAQSEIREAIRLEPDSAIPHAVLASLYHTQKDFDASLAELREIVRTAPSGALERLALAHELETAGHSADAIAAYKAVVLQHPDRLDASALLVDLYVKQNDRNSTIEELRRSLKSTSLLFSDESVFVDQRWDDEARLAQLLKINHDLDAATEQYLYMLHFKPDDGELHNDYGMLLIEEHRCNDAVAEFNESIRLSDEVSYPRSNVALCLSTQKDYEGAARELKSILESEPDSPIAENNVAWIYATADDPKLRNPAEALRLAQQAVQTSPQPNAAFIDTLAEALLLNGNADEALATEQQAVELAPGNPEYHDRLEHFRDAANKSSHASSAATTSPSTPTTAPY